MNSLYEKIQLNFVSFFLEIFDNGPTLEEENIRVTLPRNGERQIEVLRDTNCLVYYYPSSHPLGKIKTYSNSNYFLFLAGEFYSDFEINMELPIDSIINNFNSLNGNWNAILIDRINKKVYLFTDYFGFNHLHYFLSPNNTLQISSSIWPFAFRNPRLEINNRWIRDKIVLHRGSSKYTFLKGVKIVLPSTIVSYNFYTSEISEVFLGTSTDKKQLTDLWDLTRIHYNYIMNKCGDKLGLTMTAGKDSRVILNSMLQNQIQPTLISGFINGNLRDLKIATQISRLKKLNIHKINMNNETDSNIIQELSILITNGSTWSDWTYILNNTIQDQTNINYWGFSGNLFAINKLESFSKVVDIAFKKCYKYDFDVSLLDQIFNFSNNSIDEFKETFNIIKHLKLDQMLVHHQRQNQNFQRVHDFSCGSRVGTPHIYFYHDRNIINYYLGLDDEDLEDQKHHFKLTFKDQKYFSKLPLNSYPYARFAFYQKKYFGKHVIDLQNILKRRKNKIISFGNKIDFYNYVTTMLETSDYTLILEYFNLDKLYYLLKRNSIKFDDFRTILLTVKSLMLLLNILKNRKFTSNDLFFNK
jgi:hypothetical protein